MLLIGLDPGLRRTGWGVIEAEGNRLSHVANGSVTSDDKADLGVRLKQLFEGLGEVLARYRPASAAVEETFVNKNPTTTLKLGQARGVVLLAPAVAGIPIAEYTPNMIKKALVGFGHADKDQVQFMVRRFMPGIVFESADAADALAIAICHAHNAQAARALARRAVPA